MTGQELKQLREDLGEAIKQRLSVADMAMICGMSPKSGPDQMRKWERGDENPSGPVSALLSILSWASVRHPIPDELNAGGSEQQFLRETMRQEILRRLNAPAPGPVSGRA